MLQLKFNFKWRIALAILALLHFATPSNAQEILGLMDKGGMKVKELERKGKKYFKDRDKGKGSGYKLYQRALYWAKRHADEKGRIIGDAEVLDERINFQKTWAKGATSTAREVATSSSGWQELGPFRWTRTTSWNPGLGRIVAVAVEPKQQQIIYAGSPGGGIWKSTDAGKSWTPMGDNMNNMSIWSIAIDPNNTNTVYLGNSAGQIMKSTDAGNSWQQIFRASGTPRRILIHPNGNIIFVGTTRALYRSSNAGSNFTEVSSYKAEDVEFKPGDPSVVYTCGDYFFRSTDGGRNFTYIDNGFVSSERMKMAVTPANPNYVYLVQKSGSSFGRIYRSTNSGASFSVRGDNGSIPRNQVYFTQASRDMAIAVSTTNAEEVHVGGMDYSRSTNGGRSFQKMATWNNPGGRSYVHADIEFMRFENGNIYFGTDGGIYRSRDNGNNCTDLTQGGLAVRQYYRIAGAFTDANMIIGGAQDNGTNIMNGSNRQFREWLGADGMECFIDFRNKNVVYGTTQNGSLYKSTDGGRSIGSINKPGNFSGNWVTPFLMDTEDNNTIYAGYSDLYRSRNGGRSWSSITTSINIGGRLDEVAVAPSNHEYIYIARDGRMWRTKDGQRSSPQWTSISNFSGNVNFIAVDPNNPERVAIATTGSRVYISTNAGSSWTNIKGNLPSIAAECVAFDDTKANGLYVGMQSGIYYTNDNLDRWVPFSKNLPSVEITDLEVHYGSRKIRAGTYGRGIWEASLYGEDGNDNTINAPTNLTASIAGKSVTLTWKDNSNNENGFAIQRSNGDDFEQIDFVSANTTTFIDENLANGTYSYRVRAYDSDRYSDFSNTVSSKVDDGDSIDVNAPTELTANVNGQNVTLTWKDNSDNENGFTIQRSNGGDFERIDFVSRNTTTFTDEGLADGTYSYRVRAYDSDSYSKFSNTVNAKIETQTNIVDNCDGCVVYRTNSEETGNADHAKENAADGDPNTYWHTNWYDDGASHPHYISIDLGQERELVGFSYLGRQEGTTGMVKDYVLFGWNGSEWIELARGEFLKSTLKQTVEFEKFTCRYLYFRAISEVDGKRWASVAEFTVRYTPNPSVKTKDSNEARPTFDVDLTDFAGLQIYPVPFTNRIHIKGIESTKVLRSMKLISTDGRVYKAKHKMDNGLATINTSHLKNGIYLLQFEINNQVKIVRIVKH